MPKPKNPTILFIGGGTGGHIAPILAVMAAVQEQNSAVRCVYVGLASDLKQSLITESTLSFERYPISAGKLNRFFTWKQLSQPFAFVRGLLQSWRLLNRLKPDVIFSKGGYVSVPLVLVAARRHIPIFCHETDSIAGMANEIISGLATTVFTAYPSAIYPKLEVEKVRSVGQPISQAFYHPDHSRPIEVDGRMVDRSKLLITLIGGSQGARVVNQLLQGAWLELLPRTQIVQLTGGSGYPNLKQAAEQLPEELRSNLFLAPFIGQGLPELLDQSRLVISRAGGTIFELAALKKAAIIIPLPSAAQDHQRANANHLATAQAAVVLDEPSLTSQQLAAQVMALLDNPDQLQQLGQNIAQFDSPLAAQEIAIALLSRL